MSSLLNANNGRVRRAVWLTGTLALSSNWAHSSSDFSGKRDAEFEASIWKKEIIAAL